MIDLKLLYKIIELSIVLYLIIVDTVTLQSVVSDH
jgi:hypothetical protein